MGNMINKIDMRVIWLKKIKETDREIGDTSAFDILKLNDLGSRKEWLEFGFQSCGGVK